MGKLIDFDFRKKAEDPKWATLGQKVLDMLPEEQRQAAIVFVINAIMYDIESGAEGENDNAIFYKAAKAILDRTHEGCYFCDSIDGNATEFTRNTKVCMLCAVKVANILQACGVKPEVAFPGCPDRPIQKTQLRGGQK
jgi:hypothetical protein